METGDPKQLAALGVVALGAFGFLFSRLGGKAPLPAVPATALARRETPVRPVGTFAFVNDPFSHPKLAPQEPKVRPKAPDDSEKKPPTVMVGSPSFGPLPLAEEIEKSPRPMEPPRSVAVAPNPPAPSLTMIGLEAIAGASDAVAFLSVGGAESQPFRPNDRVKGAIRLLRVEDGTVVLSGPKGEFTLDVGERKSL